MSREYEITKKAAEAARKIVLIIYDFIGSQSPNRPLKLGMPLFLQ